MPMEKMAYQCSLFLVDFKGIIHMSWIIISRSMDSNSIFTMAIIKSCYISLKI